MVAPRSALQQIAEPDMLWAIDQWGHIMRRRSVLRAGLAGGVAALLPRFAIGQAAGTHVLRFVPQANLTVLDPIVTTAA